MPAGGTAGSRYVERSTTFAASKIVMSASAPTRRRPFACIACTRRSRRCAGMSVIFRIASISVRATRLPDEATEHPRKCAGRARMARAVLPIRVAGDHRERAADGGGHHLLRVRVDHDGAADLSVFLKGRTGQSLARSAATPAARLVPRSPSRTRRDSPIEFRSCPPHTDTPRSRCPSPSRAAAIMFNSSRVTAVPVLLIWTTWSGAFVAVAELQRLFESGDAAPDVRMDRHTIAGRHTKDFDQLRFRGGRRVGKSGADADGAVLQTIGDPARDFLDLRRRRSAMSAIARWEKRARITEDSHPYRNVTDADAVVDQRPTLPGGVPRAMSPDPTSSSNAVVTPSRAWNRYVSGVWPCACRSMNPGETTSPDASMTVRPFRRSVEIAAIVLPLCPRSGPRRGRTRGPRRVRWQSRDRRPARGEAPRERQRCP